MVDEHVDNVKDATEEPVEAEEPDQEHVNIHLGLNRRPKQDSANDQGQDAVDQHQPPGALLGLHLMQLSSAISILLLSE